MKHDSKLSGVLHVLLHMLFTKGPATSEQLAKMMETNPVVVRRVMAGLREQGFVASAKGHGGGWTVVCDPAAVTLADIYKAVGEPPLVALGHRSDNPQCLVEQAVNHALDTTFREVEALFQAKLASVRLADLSKDFNRRLRKHSRTHKEHAHG